MDALLQQFSEISALEAAGAFFSVVYLVLAIRENLWCWPAAFVSSVLTMILMFERRLYAESVLNVYYVAMAVYGWYQWRYGGTKGAAGELPISVWPLKAHALAIGGTLALSAVIGRLMADYTDAAFPYLDTFVSVGSLVTTYMVARKILENWLYWLVVDSLSLYLYWQRDLNLYVLLFAVYLVLVVIGLVRWHRDWRARAPVPA
ncbi:MAG TPA: nicotinamide riboside transporter PnuC [Gammaproteobacteria bacterium]|nr:nicotinamide riboside transporter PnuC [Gammaproteobacteria bacterium]